MSTGLLVVLAVGLAVVFQRVVRPRLRPADWNWRVRPEPLPEQIDEAHEREAWRVRYDAVRSRNTGEKVLLLGLVCAIFGEMLPDYTGSVSNLFAGVALVVVLNTMTSLAIARRAWTIKTIAATFAARLALNIAFATVANWILDNQIDGWDTLFFLTMISLITTLHDRWRPIHEFRTREPAAGRLA